MLSYRIDCQQNDGSWSATEFMAIDDDHAIIHALTVRTANTSELYQANRWLATFDRAPAVKKCRVSGANDNKPRARLDRGLLKWRPRPTISIDAPLKAAARWRFNTPVRLPDC
jgi:hypothetical protein